MHGKGGKFYVAIGMKNGKSTGHSISPEPITLEAATADAKTKHKAEEKEDIKSKSAFSDVFADFVSAVETHMRFMPITLQVAPQLASLIAEREIQEFAKSNGTRIEEASTAESDVYELDMKFWRQVNNRHDELMQATEGVKLLPQILVVGLISTYDAFLASLLRAVIHRKPEIFFTSQKSITFGELLDFSSIEDARSALIEREIEAVIRKSHHEQFDWMANTFNLKLKENLEVWPRFVELCERRNLFTHTGGIVSAQYIKNCTEHGKQSPKVKIGDKLRADTAYYSAAAEIVYEIGLKLCYVLWRKFDPDDVDTADKIFNSRALELINIRKYALAERLLSFSRGSPKITDGNRRMMVVNLANAITLQDRKDEANKILDAEDWSATSDEFKLCVASVRGSLDDVIALMDELGTRMSPEKYRDWPVFRLMRRQEAFRDKFERLFGEPLLTVSTTGTASPALH